jgi:hypothetical protein
MDATCGLAFLFPLPVEACASGELPLKNDFLFVVGITLGLSQSVCGFDQPMLSIVLIGGQRLNGVPGVFEIVRWNKLLKFIRDGPRLSAKRKNIACLLLLGARK